MADTEAEDLDTLNRFAVGSTGDRVAIMNLTGPRPPLTKAEALNLAAWLVAVADPGRATFDALLQRILET